MRARALAIGIVLLAAILPPAAEAHIRHCHSTLDCLVCTVEHLTTAGPHACLSGARPSPDDFARFLP